MWDKRMWGMWEEEMLLRLLIYPTVVCLISMMSVIFTPLGQHSSCPAYSGTGGAENNPENPKIL